MTYLKGVLHKQNDKVPILYYDRGKSDFDPEKLFLKFLSLIFHFFAQIVGMPLKMAACQTRLRNPKNNFFAAV